MRERDIERHLVERVKALGGMCIKFTSPGRRGVPDRIVLLPNGCLWFVELKRPGGVVEAHQAREHARMLKLGQRVLVLDTIEKIDGVLG
jgi:hypothetical protein